MGNHRSATKSGAKKMAERYRRLGLRTAIRKYPNVKGYVIWTARKK